MSLSAPTRCSLFIPGPGSKQLALVKKELHLWNTFFPFFFSRASQFAASFFSPICQSLSLSFLLFSRLPLRYFLVSAAVSQSSGSTVSRRCSINTRAGFCLPSCSYMPANSNTSQYWQCREIKAMRGTNKGPLTAEQRPKFIIHRVINSILWIARQCPHPGTIDDIQPTWLNPISKADGRSWAHLPCNHITAAWVNQTCI